MAYTIEKGKKLIPADNGCFQYVGRIDFDDPRRPVMAWPGSYADVNFTGTSAAVVMKNINLQQDTHFAVIVDGVMKKITLPTNREDELFTAAEGLEDKQHTLRILKTMASHNYIELVGIVVDEGAEVTNPAHKYDMKLEVYGDSVSAGEVTEALYYEGQCDPEDHRNRLDNSHFAYPMALARKLNAELHDIATGKANEFSLSGMKFDLMQKQWERADFELEQDKAAYKLLEEMTGEGEYARLLGKFLKILLGYIK